MIDVAPPAQRSLDVVRECAPTLCYGVFDEIANLTLRSQSATPCGAEVTAV